MKPTRDSRRVLLLAAWWLAGGVFLLAGVLKLRSLPGFLVAIEGYRLVPFRLAIWLAIWVPWLEIAAAVCLISGVWRRAGGVILTALLVVFTGAVVSAWARGLDIECGCLTAGADSKVGPMAIVRNVCFLVLVAPAWLCAGPGAGSTTPGLQRSPHEVGGVATGEEPAGSATPGRATFEAFVQSK